MSISCSDAQPCPYLFDCFNGKCQHRDIFPLSVYTSCVYALLTIGVMLCNVGGISAGIFKVPILMDLLNYPVDIATTLSYPIVTGASMSNFIQLIPKRHPDKDTSLVDYHLVLILIPCVCFGTTFGVIIVQFMSLFAQDVLLLTVFIIFTIFFGYKLSRLKAGKQEDNAMFQLTANDQNINQHFKTLSDRLNTMLREETNLKESQEEIPKSKSVEQSVTEDNQPTAPKKTMSLQQIEPRKTETKKDKYAVDAKYTIDESDLEELQTEEFPDIPPSARRGQLHRKYKYEAGWHLRDILLSILVFLIFESLALFAQGRLIKFDFCSWYFPFSSTLLLVVFTVYMISVYRYIDWLLKFYRYIDYEYDVRLDSPSTFTTVACGGFVGGILQGILGVGAGDSIVTALLTVGVAPRVASATSGYQIFFAGMSSLIGALAYSEISWADAGWLFGICFVVGGLLTLGLYYLLRNSPKAQKTLLAIIMGLCILCIVGIIPNIYLTQLYYGWNYMISILNNFCST